MNELSSIYLDSFEFLPLVRSEDFDAGSRDINGLTSPTLKPLNDSVVDGYEPLPLELGK